MERGLMMKIWIIFAMVLLAIPLSYSLPMSCQVQDVTIQPCNSPNIAVFSMIELSNSHAGIWNAYNYRVCCSNLLNAVLGSGTSVVWLASSNNAHVSNQSNAAFPNQVEVKLGSDAPLNCEVRAASCQSGWAALGSMMYYNNSHVGDADQHTYKICCEKNCSSYQDTCGGATETCCAKTPTGNPMYCATKDNYGVAQPASDWHCCEAGYWWDPNFIGPGVGGCAQTVECALPTSTTAFGDSCIINILSNTAGWFADTDCRQPAAPTFNYGCCNVSYFNTYSYGWNAPIVYGRVIS